jgi:2-succinyl-5-enolpyruvyl-6-hydroxy-3-cyclohexene-1-carboxylate synthase
MWMENGNHAPRADGFDMSTVNPNYLQAELLWAQIHAAGVEHVVISPGSRSTPLARAAFLSSAFSAHVVVDERSAAFYALGLAKGNHKPVALVCTSGTAAAHYYPAVIEAAQSGVPLVIVTADRPQRLRNKGAMQTIDQPALFGKYTRMCLDLPEPKASLTAMRDTLSWVKRALTEMLSAPQGPIQINVPMDEPLAPVEQDAAACNSVLEELQKEIGDIAAAPQTTADVTSKAQMLIENCYCGLIVCGPDAARTPADRVAIHELARKLGWPLLADVASGLRFSGEPNMPYYDLFLRHESLARIAPDVVLEFGMTPTSKTLTQYLNKHRAKTIRIQPDDLPRDPDERATETIVTDVAKYVNDLRGTVKVSRDSLLLDPFWKAVGTLRSLLSRYHIPAECELAYVHTAINELPDHSNLVLASSMSIRYADMIAAPAGRSIHVYAQRGTNGIDGVLSHAAGIAESSKRQTLLITGDLAFWHDLQGLGLLRGQDLLTVFLINNDGGGIFDFLPISEFKDTFEELHGTPQKMNLQALTREAKVPCFSIRSVDECRDSFREMLPCIYEVASERKVNHAAHQYFVESILREFD